MSINIGIFSTDKIKLKPLIYIVLRILVAVSLLVYLFSMVNFNELQTTLRFSNLFILSLSIILLVPNIWLQYLKWRLTINLLIGERSKRKVFLSLFYGFPAAVFTPVRAGEYFGRGLAFKNEALTDIVLATAVDKFFTILVTFTVGGIGMIIYMSMFYRLDILISLILICIFCIISALIINFIFFNKILFNRLLLSFSKYKFFSRIEKRLTILRNINRVYFYRMTIISSIFYLCYVGQLIILFIAFSHHSNLSSYFLAAILIMFTKAILSPLSISELGIREGASLYFLTRLGELPGVALNASLALFTINILIPSALGVILLFVKNND